MRFSILFFLAPAAVLGDKFIPATFSGGDPTTGPLCCNQGTADPSGTCQAMGLNAYACESFRLNDSKDLEPFFEGGNKGGCDNPVVSGQYPVGRDVKGFVASSKDTINLGANAIEDTYLGFIGCAA
ncbi:hypothetical protein LX36DRAFT_582863 [Colletotrichum falcatum]|nr:hypothetical protein LX36DRAFT_582863 [Colletotrichum falcatum]